MSERKGWVRRAAERIAAMHWERSMRRFRSRRHRWPELRSWDWTDDVPF